MELDPFSLEVGGGAAPPPNLLKCDGMVSSSIHFITTWAVSDCNHWFVLLASLTSRLLGVYCITILHMHLNVCFVVCHCIYSSVCRAIPLIAQTLPINESLATIKPTIYWHQLIAWVHITILALGLDANTVEPFLKDTPEMRTPP